MFVSQEKEWEIENQQPRQLKKKSSWPAARSGCIPMPLLRSRLLIPLLAFILAACFFWSIDRYDRPTVDRLTSPIRNQFSSPRTQVPLPPPKPLNQFCNSDRSVIPYPPLAFSEWLSRRSYTRVYMRPNIVDSSSKFSSVEPIVDRQVLPPFRYMGQGLDMLHEDPSDASPCPPVIDVDIAEDDSVDETDKILFGLATDVNRLRRQLPALLYSFAHTKASLLVLVPSDTQDIDSHNRYFRSRGLDVTIQPSPLEFTARYFGLVEAFTDHIQRYRPHTQWVAWMDDDTFFLSLARTAKRLAAVDPTKKHFIGALSESTNQIDMFGHIAFGGAGVFVSKPLLSVLHAVYQVCLDTGEQPGDQKLAQCVQRYGGTELTQWDWLYQMDIRGSPDGMYESGREIDTLHHWTSWYDTDVVMMGAVAAVAGRNSVLRRWKFGEKIETTKEGYRMRSFWVFTNGYSLIKYTMDARLPKNTVDLGAVEKTWDEDQHFYEDRLHPMRPVDEPGVRKDRWSLMDSVVVGNNVHQLYTHELMDEHSVIEVVWLPPGFTGDNQPTTVRTDDD